MRHQNPFPGKISLSGKIILFKDLTTIRNRTIITTIRFRMNWKDTEQQQHQSAVV